MVFRGCILVVASLAAYAVYPVSSKRLKKQHIFISGQCIECSLFNAFILLVFS